MSRLVTVIETRQVIELDTQTEFYNNDSWIAVDMSSYEESFEDGELVTGIQGHGSTEEEAIDDLFYKLGVQI